VPVVPAIPPGAAPPLARLPTWRPHHRHRRV